MANLTQSQATVYLRELGWRVRTTNEFKQQVMNFQRGWNLGVALEVDGEVGTNTSAALRKSIARKRSGLSDASAHFSFSEFACKCGGRYASCTRIKILRVQIQRLEKYREQSGAFRPVSGYRCPLHNDAVGGAKNSQHLYGGSADVPQVLPWRKVRDMRLFAGIGYVGATGKVAHVDSRDKTGQNTTSGTPSNPTIWVYR